MLLTQNFNLESSEPVKLKRPQVEEEIKKTEKVEFTIDILEIII